MDGDKRSGVDGLQHLRCGNTLTGIFLRKDIFKGSLKGVFLAILSLFISVKGVHGEESQHLRVGDVILIELNCYSCRAISQSTASRYHHSGLVVEVPSRHAFSGGTPESESSVSTIRIAQSLSKVEVISLSKFLAQAKSGSFVAHLRPRELESDYSLNREVFDEKTATMVQTFREQFVGKPFDPAFLWDNVSPQGEELLYCSEMIQKTLNTVLETKLKTVSMDFSQGYDFWNTYFNGHVPQGKEGNSPASLYRAEEVAVVQEGLLTDMHPFRLMVSPPRSF